MEFVLASRLRAAAEPVYTSTRGRWFSIDQLGEDE